MIRMESVSLRYGGVHAVNEVTLDVAPGSRVALIGPNGAGKSSLLSLMGGQSRTTSGRIMLGEHDITRLSPSRRSSLGIARSFQITSLMPDLSVHDQAELACLTPGRLGWVRRRGVPEVGAVGALLEDWAIPIGVWGKKPSSLSYGQQRSLELALAMARKPRLLLLDEPNVGLTPGENTELVQRLASLGRETTVVLVAHDMDMVFGFAERVIVMQRGRIIVDGAPAEVRADETVRNIYFGSAAEV